MRIYGLIYYPVDQENMYTSHREPLSELISSIKTLSNGQLTLIQESVDAFNKPYIKIERNVSSNLVSEKFLFDFGDLLRIHHCYSKQPFSKDKFEYALERVCNINNLNAQLSTTGNPGNDITIDGVGVSLKTQADSNIRVGKVHISKFMELGKGDWSDKISDLIGLRQQFFDHMSSYDQIFTLRCLSKKSEHYKYELVEIPKKLLLEAEHGELSIQAGSKQNPKPGYCRVKDVDGKEKYQLYFDGGGERKLQVKNILKEYCTVHAQWEFSLT